MKRLFYILAFLLFGQGLSASHFMGGEISWECLANGNFRFIVVVYRECAGIQYSNAMTLESNSPAGNIMMSLYPNSSSARVDISPDCNPDPSLSHIDCASTPFGSQYANSGAIEKWTYTSDAAYPNGVKLNGTPPASGWYFAFDGCCRNPCTNIPNSNSIDWYLRAVMYPYEGRNTFPCFDNSPEFIEPPYTVICTGYPFRLSQYAHDDESDSLTFEWAQPLDGSLNYPITNFNPGYSYTSPLPGPFHNPANVNAVMDPETGDISCTSFTQGAFVIVSKISAFRDNIKVAEVLREQQIILLNCGPNLPPQVSVRDLQSGDTLQPVSPGNFVDTVYVGSQVEYQLEAIDTLASLLPNGMIPSVIMNASGTHFGQGFSADSSGCQILPCATLDPPPTISAPYGLSSTFNWNVSLNHYLKNAGSPWQTIPDPPYYDFYLTFMDDYCPVPGLNKLRLRLYVQDTMLDDFSYPKSYCIVPQNQYDVLISWRTATDPYDFFQYYKLYRKPSVSGNFVLIDSTGNLNDTSYLDPGATVAGQSPVYRLMIGYGISGLLFEEEVFTGGISHFNVPSFVCATQPFSVEFVSGGQFIDSLYWNFDGADIISGSGTGPYLLQADTPGTLNLVAEISNECGLFQYDEVIPVHPIFDVSVSGDRFFCPNKPLELNASGGDLYSWSTGQTTSGISLTNINDPLTIGLTVTDISTGCSVEDSVYIREIQTYLDSRICMVGTGLDDQKNYVILSDDPIQDIKSYSLYYRDLGTGQWELMDTYTSQERIIRDELNNPSYGQLFYTIQVVDSCNRVSDYATAAAPPFLIGQLVNNEVRLNWQPYLGSSEGKTKLYKQDSPNRDYRAILDIMPGQKSYNEVIDPESYASYVIGRAPFYCIEGSDDTVSFSNAFTVNAEGVTEEDDFGCSLQIHTGDDGNRVVITWTNGKAKKSILEIYDLLGRKHCEIEVGRAPLEVYNLGTLQRGVLLYSIYSNDDVILKGKLLHLR